MYLSTLYVVALQAMVPLAASVIDVTLDTLGYSSACILSRIALYSCIAMRVDPLELALSVCVLLMPAFICSGVYGDELLLIVPVVLWWYAMADRADLPLWLLGCGVASFAMLHNALVSPQSIGIVGSLGVLLGSQAMVYWYAGSQGNRSMS